MFCVHNIKCNIFYMFIYLYGALSRKQIFKPCSISMCISTYPYLKLLVQLFPEFDQWDVFSFPSQLQDEILWTKIPIYKPYQWKFWPQKKPQRPKVWIRIWVPWQCFIVIHFCCQITIWIISQVHFILSF